MKIHANFKAFAAVNFDPSKYIPSPSYGVNRFMLDRVGSEKARATTIVQYEPNSKFPEHNHIGGEEFLVLEGTFKDQFGEFGAGTYVRNPIGSQHAPWVDSDGCTIFVKLLQMADTGEGITSLHVKLDKKSGTETEYGRVLELYQNAITGEHVEMCWIDSNQLFPLKDDKGEELFILDGSLFLPVQQEYSKWGWIRFPANHGEEPPSRSQLKAGPLGAQVFRKTGHLTEQAMSMEKIQISED
jgi:hypothetical protein